MIEQKDAKSAKTKRSPLFSFSLYASLCSVTFRLFWLQS